MRRLTILLTLSLAGLVLWCAPALAHADLLKAEPAAGASVSGSPGQVQLRFTEPVSAEFSPIEVYDSAGKRVDQDNARVSPDDSRIVEIGVGDLSKGSYRVEWRVTSVDGHPVDGKYNFKVKGAGSAGRDNAQANAGDNQKQNAKASSSGSSGESGSGGQDDTGGGSGQTTLYVAVGVGALVIIALALFGATRLRQNKS